MPAGHRERSLRSRPSHSATPTFVARVIVSSDTPRCRRIRRRFGPKDSRGLMPQPGARSQPSENTRFLRSFTRPRATHTTNSCKRLTGLLVEFALRRRLFGADPARDDVRARVVLALHLRAREAA